MNKILQTRTIECGDNHITPPLYFPHFLYRWRAHVINIILTKFVQIAVKYDTPTEVEGPVGLDGVKEARGVTLKVE